MEIQKIRDALESVLRKQGEVVMMELPEETYFQSSVESIHLLTELDYHGVYVSFQRPFSNIKTVFEQKNIDINKMWCVDVATALESKEREKDEKAVKKDEAGRVTHISHNIDVDELVRAVYTALDELDSEKRFVFIDSLTTIALYKPLSETLRFSEFLSRTVRKHEVEKIVLIFNVAQSLAQKKFIQDIALHVDEVVKITDE